MWRASLNDNGPRPAASDQLVHHPVHDRNGAIGGPVRRIGTAERRVRLAIRHHLAPPCRTADVVTAAADMVGLHATDPASVYLEAFARVADLTFDSIESALYEKRSLLKFLGISERCSS